MNITSIDELIPEDGELDPAQKRELLSRIRKAARAQFEAYQEWLRHHASDREVVAIFTASEHLRRYGSYEHITAPDIVEVAQAAEQRFMQWYMLRNRHRDEKRQG